ncbi:MAG TPA: hypothetical protein PKG48_08395, partial [Bacteroidales bacterium]|nr:hypothetical protein [Bacteroidales bacterium]
YRVWIIDGNAVRRDIYNEFLYGGNEQRYPFVPKGEIWIDHAISVEEFELTVEHEMNERHLMAKLGWSYDRAHDSSLALEVKMRRIFAEACQRHESGLKAVSPTDHDGIKEIATLPDSVRLAGIYRVPLGMRDGVAVWVVDGYRVRAEIFPDFGLSGNDLAYRFIPSHEIWIDGQMSCEETGYSIAVEMLERQLMEKGFKWGAAYDSAINENTRQRRMMRDRVLAMPPVQMPDSVTRELGRRDPSEPE